MARIMALVIVLAGLAGGLGLGAVLSPTGAAPGSGARGEPGDVMAGDVMAGDVMAGDALAASDAGATGAEDAAAPAVGVSYPARAAGISDRAYVKLGRQIVVPVVEARRTEALMLFELALDVPTGMTERAYAAEPRLRDAFLRALLRMSYTGAFTETYTDERVTRELRDKLRQEAERLLEGAVFDVLILDMLRQEL